MRKKPWWYITKTCKQQLGMGLMWTLFAAAQWVLLDYNDVTTRRLLPPSLFSVLAVVYMTSWAFRRLRERDEGTSV